VILMYKVVWDNGVNATGEFPYDFETWEEANDYGKDWAWQCNVRDGLLELDDSDRYSYDVVEMEADNEQARTVH
jgi:hypothetical protein